MIKKIGLVFIGLLIMVTVGEAQLRYVVPGGSGTGTVVAGRMRWRG